MEPFVVPSRHEGRYMFCEGSVPYMADWIMAMGKFYTWGKALLNHGVELSFLYFAVGW